MAVWVMGQAADLFKQSLISTFFATAMFSGAAAQAPAHVEDRPLANIYLEDGSQGQCTLIDGRGAQTEAARKSAEVIRANLQRFPLGAAAVTDLQDSNTTLCFSGDVITSRETGLGHSAEYKHRLNAILLTGTDEGHFMHEWKHKHDGVDFDSFKMSPFSAVLTLRFAEAGAYAFEAMARHEAKEKGVEIDAPSRGSLMARLVDVYDETLSGGGTQEQAWRNAFDASFEYNLKHVQTGSVLRAYRQAMDIPEIRNQEGFAGTVVTPEFLKKVALPPGWDTGTFDRTGSGLILGDERYITYRPEHASEMRTIQAELAGPQR